MQTLILEAIIINNIINIGIHKTEDTVMKYDNISVPIDEIEQRCHELTERLNQHTQTGANNPSILTEIKSVGKLLCDKILPPNIKNFLKTTDVPDMNIIMDDGLVHIPWELIYLDDQFLCERFNLGRSVKVKQELMGTQREINRPLSTWIIINAENELSDAKIEGDTLYALMKQANEPDAFITDFNNEVFVDDVKESINNYDIVHYAGHADYDENDQVNCGWRLCDGHFSPTDIHQLSGITTMPSLIFSNACQTARTLKWRSESSNNKISFGFVNSFILSGVRHYIGTAWKIGDKPGNLFAVEFYQNLFNSLPIGESFRKAKLKLMQKNPGDLSWASYVLYGNPSTTYTQNLTRGSRRRQRTISVSSYAQLKKMMISLLLVILIYPLFLISKNTYEWFVYLNPQGISENFIDHRPNIYFDEERLKCIKEKNREQKEKERLMNEISKNIKARPIQNSKQPDNWTSFPLTIGLVMGESFRCIPENRRSINDVVFAIENDFQKYNRLIIVDTFELNDILEEIHLATSKLVSSQRKIQPNLFPAYFLLNLNYQVHESNIRLYVRVRETISRKTIGHFTQPIDNTNFISDQTHQLSTKIAQKIISLYPLRGYIEEIKTNTVVLNIGYEEGVRVKQRFKVVKNNNIFQIESVTQNTSIATLEKMVTLQKGMKVIAYDKE